VTDKAEDALSDLHIGLKDRNLEVKGDGDWEQMVKTVLLLIDQQQPLLARIEELGQRLKDDDTPLKLESFKEAELEPDPEFLLIVALRTDQHDVARRVAIILNAAAPKHPRASAEVYAHNEPTVAMADALRAVCNGDDVLARLGWTKP
jgi:hypothetical protein